MSFNLDSNLNSVDSFVSRGENSTIYFLEEMYEANNYRHNRQLGGTINFGGTSGDARFKIQSNNERAGRLIFGRSDFAAQEVIVALSGGNATPREFDASPSGTLSADYRIGGNTAWNAYNVNANSQIDMTGYAGSAAQRSGLALGIGTITISVGGTNMLRVTSAGDLRIRGTLASSVIP